jgi:Na+(H+)/acetate symporter ActP
LVGWLVGFGWLVGMVNPFGWDGWLDSIGWLVGFGWLDIDT